ncbi:protein TMEPAI [Eucyclogobius newberryi]|uniref:protein TMEPAI n=1 Tax=Eucyclogobius newberryi TaxID=166745 RepID=UPI003B5A24C9
MLNLMGVLNATSANVSCTCNCKRFTSLQSMEITQLEFVQILVIVVVMMVMVVVITCVLNHYRLSARSLIHRHGTERRRHQPLANEASLWSSEGTNVPINESQVYSTRPPDRLQPPSMPPRFQTPYGASRFQPTYPYLPRGVIELPPTIALSDGEEPPPYAGPCTLQLRDPEQQRELNRESVRAPPNRTVFDSQLVTHGNCAHNSLQLPPPSVHSGVSVLEAQESRHQHKQSRVDGAPPTYSEVIIGHFYHPSNLPPDHNRTPHGPGTRTAPAPPHSILHGLLHSSTDQRNSRNSKDKPHKQRNV